MYLYSTILSYISGIPARQGPSEKGFILKRKNLLPAGANSFVLEKTPFQKGGQNDSDSCLP